MTKNKLKGLLTLGSLIMVIGFILLFFSVEFGLAFAENWIVKQEGRILQHTYLSLKVSQILSWLLEVFFLGWVLPLLFLLITRSLI